MMVSVAFLQDGMQEPFSVDSKADLDLTDSRTVFMLSTSIAVLLDAVVVAREKSGQGEKTGILIQVVGLPPDEEPINPDDN